MFEQKIAAVHNINGGTLIALRKLTVLPRRSRKHRRVRTERTIRNWTSVTNLAAINRQGRQFLLQFLIFSRYGRLGRFEGLSRLLQSKFGLRKGVFCRIGYFHRYFDKRKSTNLLPKLSDELKLETHIPKLENYTN